MRATVTALLLLLAQPAALAAPEPDPEPAIGAMPVPAEDDFWSAPPSLDEVDTTVTLDELSAIRGWPKAKRSKYKGRVMLALHAARDWEAKDSRADLRLSIIRSNTGEVSGFSLGATNAEINNHTFDGTTFPARDFDGVYAGPIVFAIRVLPGPGADERQRRQVAVWADGTTLKVAERPSGGAWKAMLRVKFPRKTRFVGIGTTFPH